MTQTAQFVGKFQERFCFMPTKTVRGRTSVGFTGSPKHHIAGVPVEKEAHLDQLSQGAHEYRGRDGVGGEGTHGVQRGGHLH